MRDEFPCWLLALTACAVLIAPAGVRADGQNVPPENPPPICDIGGGVTPNECHGDSIIDYYEPKYCPNHIPNLADPDDTAQPWCRPAQTPPLATIHCWNLDPGRYLCEGGPASAEGALTYRWTSSADLDISSLSAGDGAIAHVDCVGRAGDEGMLTLTVSTPEGLSASITGPLGCQPMR